MLRLSFIALIGHQHDTDISKFLRVQSDVVIRADGKKREGMIDKLTVYKSQNSSDKSAWDWYLFGDSDDPENQIHNGRLIKDWEEFQDEGDDETVKPVKCRGSNRKGESCGQLTDHISDFCSHHRDQWQGDDDPRFEE